MVGISWAGTRGHNGTIGRCVRRWWLAWIIRGRQQGPGRCFAVTQGRGSMGRREGIAAAGNEGGARRTGGWQWRLSGTGDGGRDRDAERYGASDGLRLPWAVCERDGIVWWQPESQCSDRRAATAVGASVECRGSRVKAGAAIDVGRNEPKAGRKADGCYIMVAGGCCPLPTAALIAC